jgi:hypothetical protein
VFGGAAIGSVLQDSGQRSMLASLLHSGIWGVVAADGESMQDHDRNRAVDKGGDSRGVFASKERPGGPCRSVGQNEPVGGRRNAVEMLGANRPHNLRQTDYAGETVCEPTGRDSDAINRDGPSGRPVSGVSACGLASHRLSAPRRSLAYGAVGPSGDVLALSG